MLLHRNLSSHSINVDYLQSKYLVINNVKSWEILLCRLFETKIISLKKHSKDVNLTYLNAWKRLLAMTCDAL